MKKFIKKKEGPNQAGVKYGTPDHFKGEKAQGKRPNPGIKFNPARFKIQHKG